MNAHQHYNRNRQRRIAEGTWLFNVPTAPVRAHVDTLLASGMTTGDVALAAGLSISTIRRLYRQPVVLGVTAQLLMKVTVRPARLRAGLIPAVGTVRRLRALAALGWSFPQLAPQLRVSSQRLAQLAQRAEGGAVAAETHERVSALFEELSATPGSSTKARRHAARLGWFPPHVWDDIDDPDAEPDFGSPIPQGIDEVAVARAARGERVRLTAAETTEILRSEVARGETLTAVTKRLGINYDGAKMLFAGGLTPALEKRARIEAALASGGSRSNRQIAAELGVQHTTVASVRRRLAQQQYQLAS